MFKKSLIIIALLCSSTLYAKSHHCHFVAKLKYSGFKDKTVNSIKKVNMWVVYRIDNGELLTKPKGAKKTYHARFSGKFLSRRGKLFYMYKSKKGYIYGISKDDNLVIEITPSGKTVLTGYCR